jgi:hypothetical protein
MGILNIRPAVRGEIKALIAIAGETGSGKTYTALQLARGMVDKPAEIGLLDTEAQRGSHYADILDGKFKIADLYPPFSPGRYREAIKEFQAEGVKVLVMDSGSHEWEGEGGCDDIANAKMGNSGMPNWIGAKREHKGYMNTLLYCNMHVITCLRAREKTDFKNPNKPTSLGVQPVCEKNFMFEMLCSMMMSNEGKSQKFLKMPEFLRPAFGSGNDYLTQETGRKIIEWIRTGEKEDPAITQIKSEMLMACEFGLAGIMAIWNTLSASMKKKLAAHKDMCKESALEYERQAAEANETPQQTLARMTGGKQAELNMP